MSLDEVKLNNELVEDVSDAEELAEEELVEDEQVQDEDILEAKAKNEDGHGDDDEDEDDVKEGSHEDEDDEDEKPMVEMPKTKAALMAGVHDMVKKAKKEQAQKIYAQVQKIMAPDVEPEKVVKDPNESVDHPLVLD